MTSIPNSLTYKNWCVSLKENLQMNWTLQNWAFFDMLFEKEIINILMAVLLIYILHFRKISFCVCYLVSVKYKIML